jgi:hypothetical protein
MSEKKCVVYPIHLKPHPASEKLHIGEVGGHQVVVGVHYEEGTLGIYIPEDAILPDDIAEDMWLKGKLAGSKKNRVKGRNFAGVFSDGLFYGKRFHEEKDGEQVLVESRAWKPEWKEGDDVTAQIGVTFKE